MEARPESRITGLAGFLAEARLESRLLQPPADADRPGSEIEAYAVQNEVHRMLGMAGWGDVVGWKIGFAARDQQARYGLKGPATGSLLANSVAVSGVSLPSGAFTRPGIECEVAFTLGKDLISAAPGAVVDAIAACHAAIEIVDNRYADLAAMDGFSLIADNVLNAGCVIGPACQLPDHPAMLQGSLTFDGSELGGGTPGESCGDPLAMLAWLASHAVRIGKPLRAGEVVLCGSVTPIAWLDSDRSTATAILAAFDGLQPVRLYL